MFSVAERSLGIIGKCRTPKGLLWDLLGPYPSRCGSTLGLTVADIRKPHPGQPLRSVRSALTMEISKARDGESGGG